MLTQVAGHTLPHADRTVGGTRVLELGAGTALGVTPLDTFGVTSRFLPSDKADPLAKLLLVCKTDCAIAVCTPTQGRHEAETRPPRPMWGTTPRSDFGQMAS